jgi:uncharacterized protein YdhG (YjbR/CyaY superfamily)
MRAGIAELTGATAMNTATTVSEYLAATPPKARTALRQLRAAIKAAAPGITERISYRIPTFDLDGRRLLYIAAFKDHVGLYPVTAAMVARHGAALAPYRSGKGTLRFTLDTPIPTNLVAQLAKTRVEEARAVAAANQLKQKRGGRKAVSGARRPSPPPNQSGR